MTSVTFIFPDGSEKVIEAANGLSLMELAQNNDIEQIEGACGGGMACATCHLYVHPEWWNKCLPEEGDVTPDEEDMLDLAFDIRSKSRLGCQIQITDDLDGLVVALPGADVDWAS